MVVADRLPDCGNPEQPTDTGMMRADCPSNPSRVRRLINGPVDDATAGKRYDRDRSRRFPAPRFTYAPAPENHDPICKLRDDGLKREWEKSQVWRTEDCSRGGGGIKIPIYEGLSL